MTRWAITICILLVVIAAGGRPFVQRPESFRSAPKAWSAIVQPGKLSKVHANLESNCQECHSPYRGVVRDQCVTCHAAQTELLKKQNTKFHASIGSCTGCHVEHQGRDSSITKMDHSHLALVGLEMLDRSQSPENAESKIISFLRSERSDYHGTTIAAEEMLNCNSCHANQDRHRSLFGSDCSACHGTTKWTIPAFRHPLPTSRDCSQCHQAPPSHYMMHFKMISEKVAGVEHAQVSQCYSCHQTTSWNDIKGVGWYKHH